MRLLLCLAEHPLHVVGIQELLDRVWPNVVVTHQSVYNAVAQLRRQLGDTADTPTYIETVPRKGYRLVAPVAVLGADASEPADPETQARSGELTPPKPPAAAPDEPALATAPARARRSWHVAALGVAVVALAAASYWAIDHFGVLRLVSKGAATRAASIAVLPFLDLSEAHDQQYLADGLAEELTNLLAQVPDLRVAARTSAFALRGNADDVHAIGDQLNVGHVLEGSVRRSGGELRITVQLIRTDTGYHVWSKTYDRTLTEILRLEDEVAGDVVHACNGQLYTVRRAPRPDPKPEAYNLLLEGRFFGRRNTREDRARSIELYRQAVALDPGYALAWAWLAQGYGVQAVEHWAPPAEGFAQARSTARHAIELDSSLADGHAALGYVLESWDFDWPGAATEYAAALSLDPTSVRVLNLNGHLALTLGRLDEAERFYRRAAATDPLSPGAWIGIINVLQRKGQLADVESLQRQLAAQAAAGVRAPLGLTLALRGDPKAGLDEVEHEPLERWRLAYLPLVEDALGHRAEADRALAELTAKYSEFPYRIAAVYASRGDADHAFEWLERARAARDFNLLWSKTDPLLARLHADPRFALLMREMNLPP